MAAFFLLLWLPLSLFASLRDELKQFSQMEPRQVAVEACNQWGVNPYVSEEERKWVTPYLLPSDHPLRPYLDALFLEQRVSQSRETFKAAGFKIVGEGGSRCHVASHPYLPDHLVKVYFDSDKSYNRKRCQEPLEQHCCRYCPGWRNLVARAMGAEKIRQAIQMCGFTDFIVPRKWLYPLPVYPSPEGKKENYVLVVEKFDLIPGSVNLKRWRDEMPIATIEQLWVMIDIGLGDVMPLNVPYTTDGRMVFLDTEMCFCPEGRHGRTLLYFGAKQAKIWKKLTREGGPRWY